MDSGSKLTSAKPNVAKIVDYTNKLGLNIKDAKNLYLDTCRLTTLSGDPVSQVFYLFCKKLRFGDKTIITLIPVVESLVRIISNLSRWSLKLLFVSIK
jgi:hypothetical protein